VDLFWQFVRTRWDATTVQYDPELGAPAGTGACATSGVDTVVVSLPDGGSVTSPCRNAGTQGVALDGIGAGRRTFVVSGLRGPTLLFRSSVQVDVVAGPPSAATTAVADVYGVYDNLDVFFYFATANGTNIPGSTCASEAVDYFTFDIYDGAGTKVVSTSMFATAQQPCTDVPPGPGVALDNIDRDNYTIRARAWRRGTLAPIYDSCDISPNTTAVWNHYGPDLGVHGWPVNLLYKSCP
jgi:hypothetical protein